MERNASTTENNNTNKTQNDNLNDDVFIQTLKSIQEEMNKMSSLINKNNTQNKLHGDEKDEEHPNTPSGRYHSRINNLIHDKLFSFLGIFITIALAVGGSYYQITLTSEKRFINVESEIQLFQKRHKGVLDGIFKQLDGVKKSELENNRLMDELRDTILILTSRLEKMETGFSKQLEDIEYKYSREVEELKKLHKAETAKKGGQRDTDTTIPKEEIPRL